MKKIFFCGVLSFIFCAGNSLGAELYGNGVEISLSASNTHYEEPGIMEEEGGLYGIVMSLNHHKYLMSKFEIRMLAGEVDYTSVETGTMNNITDFLFELRWLLGRNFTISDSWAIGPYTGFGYRYLLDDMSGRSSTGHLGYERESNYLYSPLGIEMAVRLTKGLALIVSGEYDYFLGGKQFSMLSDVHPGYGELKNKQDDGKGYRWSARLLKRGQRVDWFIEAFYIRWEIEKSDIADITWYGYLIGYGYEPKNESEESGIKAGWLF